MTALLLVLAVFAFGVWLFLHDKAASSPGEVIYRDADGRAESLLSDRYGLKGKPDYVVRSRGALLPVEVKSRACGSRKPYDSEKAQLFAYCLLVEDQWGTTVRLDILQYRDRRIVVPFGERERQHILALLQDMHVVGNPARRSHSQPGRCRGCGFRSECPEALP